MGTPFGAVPAPALRCACRAVGEPAGAELGFGLFATDVAWLAGCCVPPVVAAVPSLRWFRRWK